MTSPRANPSSASWQEAVNKSTHTFEAVRLSHRVVTSSAASRVSRSFWRQGAVVALEEALEPMLEALCNQALEHARKNGREEITEADLKAVSKNFKGK